MNLIDAWIIEIISVSRGEIVPYPRSAFPYALGREKRVKKTGLYAC